MFRYLRRVVVCWAIWSVSATGTSRAIEHWAFQAVQQPAVPSVANDHQLYNAVDAFVLATLEDGGIEPSPPASARTLIRRVTLDLTGLPPTPAEVDAFLLDQSPHRYEQLVDRLLDSPAYGERWARPWLDLCHYADTDGYLTDQLRPVAWRYRDWLVNALNRNTPFDEFTISQLAGDLLPDASSEQILATGFLRQTLSNREGGAEPEEFRVKQVVDRTEMVGTIWLGLTVGCARCHDHKYDPFEQREFFELYACLNNVDEVNIDAPLPHERAAFQDSRAEFNRRRQALVDPRREAILDLQARWEKACLNARQNPGSDHLWDRQWELLGLVWGGGLGEGQLEGQEIVRLPFEQRTSRQQDDLLDYFLRSGSVIDGKQFQDLKLGQLSDQLRALKAEFPHATRAPVMHASLNFRQTNIHERGEFRDLGEMVAASAPDCLPQWTSDEKDPRLSLAQWLVSGDNPLTARVTVNRMWNEFFGRGLVATTEDFGTRGEQPSHPDLLDWLAAEFVRSEWNVKSMHRLIVCSATYRRSSLFRPDLAALDPENVLLARQNALRVPAETVRDIGLAVSGLLHNRIGGPSARPAQPESVTLEAFGTYEWSPSPVPDCFRRALYTFSIRTTPYAQSVTFDAPNPNEICTRRARSNTPLQALTLLNDPVFVEMAQALAARLLRQPDASEQTRIDCLVRVCLGRRPTDDESRVLSRYLASQLTLFQADESNAAKMVRPALAADVSIVDLASWTCLCSVVMNLHEFITRE